MQCDKIYAKVFDYRKGLIALKKMFAVLLAMLILLSSCGKESVGTDFDFSSIIDTTVKQTVAATPNPEHASLYGEWTVINAVRSGIEVDEGWYNTYYQNLCMALNENDGVLSSTKNTVYSRVIIALTAIGRDPFDVVGYNLFDHYKTMDEISKQGISGVIFALIALNSGSYMLPTDADVTVDDLINYILELEFENGGWAIIGESADVDITAQVLQALAPHRDNEMVAAATERAVELLSSVQTAEGGFYAWEGINSQTTAQVIIALTSLGINPRTDERFIKEKGWMGSYIMQYYLGDGSFCHTLGKESDPMATDQCLQALLALKLADEGKGAFYDIG